MLAVSEQHKEVSGDMPEAIMEIARWLARNGPARVSIRPICPVHGDLMNAGKTPEGQTHYYCPKFSECGESRKVKAREV